MTTVEQEVKELKTRIDRLEAMVRSLVTDTHKAVLPAADESQNQDHLLAWLKTQGLVRDSTPEEHRSLRALRSLPPSKPGGASAPSR